MVAVVGDMQRQRQRAAPPGGGRRAIGCQVKLHAVEGQQRQHQPGTRDALERLQRPDDDGKLIVAGFSLRLARRRHRQFQGAALARCECGLDIGFGDPAVIQPAFEMCAHRQPACAVVEHGHGEGDSVARDDLPASLRQRHDQRVVQAVGDVRRAHSAGAVTMHRGGGWRCVDIPHLPVVEFRRQPSHDRPRCGRRWGAVLRREWGRRHFVIVHGG
jgi:hypothetical protein